VVPKQEVTVKRKYGALAVFLAVVMLVSAFGAQFDSGQWYAELIKPDWNPPAWVFAPVWSALYLMIAIAAWLVWTGGHAEGARALGLWVSQLVLNGAWSWLFFGLHRPGWALGEMALLIAALALTLRAFYRIRPLAAWLLVPYLAWLLFAWALNFALWRLNGGGLGTVFGS
jgi:benzodiazapine receptor